jgi:hypothetical protein
MPEYFSSQTSESFALTKENKIITATSTATATSNESQSRADEIAKQISKQISQIDANTQASLVNTANLNQEFPTLTYYLLTEDFIKNIIKVESAPLNPNNEITDSLYIYGNTKLYNEDDISVGICSASFMCSKNAKFSYTDITNYISLDNGLIVSWLTPSFVVNLEVDNIINGLVTECIVKCTTKIGDSSFFYGKTANLKVSTSRGKIVFTFTSYNA